MTAPPKQMAYVGAYGFGHYGKSLLWNFAGLLFAYYLTEVAALPPSAAGLLIGGSMLINAAADLLLGHWFSTRITDCAAAARFQRVGALSASLALVAFVTGAFVPIWARGTWLITTLLGFRLAYSLFDVPQNAYLAFASSNVAARAALSSIRYTAAGAATLSVGIAFAPIAMMRGDSETRLAFLGLAAFAAIITVIGAQGVASQPLKISGAPTRDDAPGFRPARHLGYMELLVAIIFVTAAIQFFTKFEAHFAALASGSALTPWLLAAAAVGQIVSQPLWSWLATRKGELAILVFASLAWGSTAIMASLAPVNGLVLLLGAFAYRACWSGLSVGIWMALAHVTAPPARTTRLIGTFTFVSKLTEAAVMPLIGVFLGEAFYNEHRWQTREIWLFMLLPAVATALLVIFLALRVLHSPLRDQHGSGPIADARPKRFIFKLINKTVE